MSEMSSHIPHIPYPYSREWRHLDCDWKHLFHLGGSMTPSRAEIGENGMCKGFSPKPTPPKEERTGD